MFFKADLFNLVSLSYLVIRNNSVDAFDICCDKSSNIFTFSFRLKSVEKERFILETNYLKVTALWHITGAIKIKLVRFCYHFVVFDIFS